MNRNSLHNTLTLALASLTAALRRCRGNWLKCVSLGLLGILLLNPGTDLTGSRTAFAAADLSAAQAANEQQTEALNEANNRVAQLEQQVSDLSRQRDEAIAAVADAKQQMGTVTELENKLRQKEEQMAGMQQAIARYEKVLGTAEEAEQRVDGIVRPLINQANKQADDTLDRVQAALAALLAQLGEVQGNVEQRRLALQRCKEDSDSRLTAAFGDLMEEPNRPSANHFFR